MLQIPIKSSARGYKFGPERAEHVNCSRVRSHFWSLGVSCLDPMIKVLKGTLFNVHKYMQRNEIT